MVKMLDETEEFYTTRRKIRASCSSFTLTQMINHNLPLLNAAKH